MPKNPYTELKRRIDQFAYDVTYRHRRAMWHYPKDQLRTQRWELRDLAERVAAAEQLGYEVHLKMDDGNLYVEYVKKIEVPYEFRP